LKNLILCFSATGNSYYIAKKIADRTDDCEIKMINEITEENFVTPERLGIIFPIHASMEPQPVDNFITEILGKADDKTNLKYIYAVSNASVGFSFWGIKRCEMLLKREGITLTYANHVKMPSNYFVKESKDSDKKNTEIIEKSNIKIDKIIEDIESEKFKFPVWKPKLIGALNHTVYLSMIHSYGANYHVSDKCIDCGLCYRDCPTDNIKMVNHKPDFSNRCVACSACINNCPTNAIYLKKENPAQYRNPLIKFSHKYRD